MPNNRGITPLILLLIVGALFTIAYLLLKDKLGTPSTKQEPTVKLQTEYQNPFSKETQYVNPFSSYKNPFDNLR